jgi:UDP-N-acetylglucosamine 3-dehydrogenase
MNIAVIGTGMMGNNHIRVLKNIPEITELVIADINEQRLRETARNFSINRVYRNYCDLLKKEELDGVIIATPPNTHRDIAVEFIKARINILVEKPVAYSLKDAREMMRLAKKKRIIFTVGHIERFNPVVKKIKQFLSEGMLKNVYLVNTYRNGPFPKRLIGKVEGVLVDLAVHDFDIIHYLVGKIKSVRSQIIKSARQEIYARVLMEIDNGIKASSEFSWISPRRMRGIEIYGDAGMIVGDYYNQEVWFYENSDFGYSQSTVNTFLSAGLVTPGKVIKFPITRQEPLFLELTNFMNAIKKKEPVMIKPEEAYLALRNVLSIK